MITITRRDARRLGRVLNHHLLGIYHRDPIPPLVLRTSPSEFRVEFQHDRLSVVYIEPGKETYIDDAIALPIEAVAALQGKSETPVTILGGSFERTVATIHFRSTDREQAFEVPPVSTLDPFPSLPTRWERCSAGLLVAFSAFANEGAGDEVDTGRTKRSVARARWPWAVCSAARWPRSAPP